MAVNSSDFQIFMIGSVLNFGPSLIVTIIDGAIAARGKTLLNLYFEHLNQGSLIGLHKDQFLHLFICFVLLLKSTIALQKYKIFGGYTLV